MAKKTKANLEFLLVKAEVKGVRVSDFRQNVGDVGLVEGRECEALLAEVVE